MAQQIKSLPAVQEIQETWIQSLGREDPLEGEMATHSSILAGKIPWTEDPGGLWSTESQRVGHDWAPAQKELSGSAIRLVDPPRGAHFSSWVFASAFPRPRPIFSISVCLSLPNSLNQHPPLAPTQMTFPHEKQHFSSLWRQRIVKTPWCEKVEGRHLYEENVVVSFQKDSHLASFELGSGCDFFFFFWNLIKKTVLGGCAFYPPHLPEVTISGVREWFSNLGLICRLTCISANADTYSVQSAAP